MIFTFLTQVLIITRWDVEVIDDKLNTITNLRGHNKNVGDVGNLENIGEMKDSYSITTLH